MFELLVFDLDGTLVDSKRDIALSANVTLEEMGFERRDPEVVYGYIGGGVHNLVLRSMGEEHAGRLDEGVGRFWANYKAHVLDSTLPYPGVQELLGSLAGRRMAVVTNKPYEHTRMVLDGLGLAKYFMNIQGWRLGFKVKPDPELLVRALRETSTPSDGAVMIGDGISDVMAARAAGTKSCAVGYGYGRKAALMEAMPDYFADEVPDIGRLFA